MSQENADAITKINEVKVNGSLVVDMLSPEEFAQLEKDKQAQIDYLKNEIPNLEVN